ncbi:hypothetical protein [Roseiconus nitratireducens]|nr:hypothetical protein [Roseiconus nitratireducens]
MATTLALMIRIGSHWCRLAPRQRSTNRKRLDDGRRDQAKADENAN